MEEGFGLLMVLLYFALIILIIAAYWKIYVKAGKPGWAVLIPIYSTLVLLGVFGPTPPIGALHGQKPPNGRSEAVFEPCCRTYVNGVRV